MILGSLVTGCSNEAKTEDADTAAATTEESATMTVGAMAVLGDADANLVRKAATIANAIEGAPQAAVKVLAENGMSAQDFEELMYKISADEKLAAAYEEARQ